MGKEIPIGMKCEPLVLPKIPLAFYHVYSTTQRWKVNVNKYFNIVFMKFYINVYKCSVSIFNIDGMLIDYYFNIKIIFDKFSIERII